MADIRKISVGPDYKNNAMHYIVGQKVLNNTYEIRHIKFDGHFYDIYIINEKEEVVLWKSFNTNMPLSVEYNIDY